MLTIADQKLIERDPKSLWKYSSEFFFCIFRCFCVYPAKSIGYFVNMAIYADSVNSKAKV